MTSIAEVVTAGLCVGCGVCCVPKPEQQAPIELIAKDGQLQPDLTHPSARLDPDLTEVCPSVYPEKWRALGGPKTRTEWGEEVQRLIGWAADPALRFRGASGGSISAILQFLLNQKLVDNVVCLASRGASPFYGESVAFENLVEDVSGSRYQPGSAITALWPLIEKEARVAVVGKPCEIAGIKALVQQNLIPSETIALTVSFFCGGLPTAHGTAMLLAGHGARTDEVTSLRYRGNGWPGEFTANLTGGRQIIEKYEESWGNCLSSHLHFRCKICPDSIGEAADLVAADAWHETQSGEPSFDEQPGRNLIIARSRSGLEIIEGAEAAGALVTSREPQDVANLGVIQPHQKKMRYEALSRIWAFNHMSDVRVELSSSNLLRFALRWPFYSHIRSMLGLIRRMLRR